MRRTTKKRALFALGCTCALAVAGGAYAYFTSQRLGHRHRHGRLQLGGDAESDDLLEPLPGPSSPVTFTVDNPSSGAQRVGTISLASITVDAGHSTCSTVITGGNPDFTMAAVAVNKTFATGNGQSRDPDRDADDERHRRQPGRLPGRDADAAPDQQLASQR